MERITADELQKLLDDDDFAFFDDIEVIERIIFTLEEMDKDIAVFEHQLDDNARSCQCGFRFIGR